MAIETGFTIEIGNLSEIYDITDQVQSFYVNSQCNLAEIGTSNGAMTIKNFAGSFTPNGGGTYGDVDWFNQAVLINGTTTVLSVPTSFNLFHGIINKFELNDNGTFSTVTISFIDAFSTGGRSDTIDTQFGSGTASSAIEFFYENTVPSLPAVMPTLGGTNTGYDCQVDLLTNDFDVFSNQAGIGTTVNQTIQTMITPVGPSMFMPTTIALTSPVFTGQLIDFTMTRNAANRTTFIFKDGNVSGTELPFETLRTGYDDSMLTNNVVITDVSSGNPLDDFNSTSTTKYGQRVRSYSECAFGITAITKQQISTASSWVERFGDIIFAPISLTFTSTQMESAANASEPFYNKLLDISTAIWQPAEITYTPTGCAEQTVVAVIKGRTVSATPEQTTITLDLVPASQYQSFILNDNYLGVLDQNRLA